MATTRSKTGSVSNRSSKDTDMDMISLSVVKELLKVQESSIKSFLSVYMDNTNQRLDQIIRTVQDLKNSLEFTQAQFEEFKKSSLSVGEESFKKMTDFADKFQDFSTIIDEVSLKVNEIDIKADDLENRSRRDNLCFDGVPESTNESWQNSEDKIKEIISSKLGIETGNYTIERAHRVGRARNSSSKPRPIVAKFANHKIRNAVLNERKHLKGTNIFIREDFSDKVLAKRRELVPKMFEARRNGMVAYLRYDKLITHSRNNTSQISASAQAVGDGSIVR